MKFLKKNCKYLFLKSNIFLIVTCLISVITITVGYSAAKSTLELSTTAIIPVLKATHISSIRLLNSTDGAFEINNSSNTINTFYTNFELPTLNSSITYELVMLNTLSYQTHIKDFLPNNMNNIDYEVVYNGSVVDINNIIFEPDSTNILKITYKYSDSLSAIPAQTVIESTTNVSFDKIKYYTVSYVDINGSFLPENALDSGVFKATLSNAPASSLMIRMNGVSLSSTEYLYNEITGDLIITCVTGNIVISMGDIYLVSSEEEFNGVLGQIQNNNNAHKILFANDITFTAAPAISNVTNLTIDLGGYTASNANFTLSGSGRVNIVNGSITNSTTCITQSGTIIGELNNVNITSISGNAIQNTGTGKTIINNSSITANAGAGINNTTGAVEITDSTIYGATNAIISGQRKKDTPTTTIYSGTITSGQTDILVNGGNVIIEGGNFHDQSFVNYVKSGYEYTYDNETNMYNVHEKQEIVNPGATVIKVNSQQSLLNAIQELNQSGGGIIEFESNINLTSSLTMTGVNSVIIDLMGYNLSATGLAANGRMIVVQGSSDVVIRDSVGTSTIQTSANAVYFSGTGSLHINGLSVSSTQSSAIYNAGTGTLSVNDSVITSNTYGVYNAAGGTIEIYESDVTGNTNAVNNNAKGKIFIYSGKFQSNQTSIRNKNGTIKVRGGSFKDTSFTAYLESGCSYSRNSITNYYDVTSS